MSEKPEETFDDEEDEDVAPDDDGLKLDEIIRDLDTTKRRRTAKTVGEPAWRKLERYLEDRRTAEQLLDFDDYVIGEEAADAPRAAGAKRRKGKQGDS